MSILSERIALIESLKIGIGLKYLMKEAYAILGKPLLMFDMDFKLLEYSQEVDIDDPLWSDMVKYGEFSPQTIELIKNEGFIDLVTTAHHIALLMSDNLQHDRFVGKLYDKDNVVVAKLMMMSNDKPFDAHDSVLFEAFCSVLSKEIATLEYFQNFSQTYQDAIVAKLISGDIHDKALFSGHAANIYGDFRDQIYVGVVDATECDAQYADAANFRNLLRQIQPRFRYYVFANHVVTIIGAEYDAKNFKKHFHRLNKLFRQKRIYAGISDSFDNIYELAKYYHQAVSALTNGKRYADEQWIFFATEQAAE